MIFFDLDDTLLDHSGAERLAAMHLASALGIDDIDGGVPFSERWRTVSEKFMMRYLCGKISFQEQRRLRIQAVLGTSLSNEDADGVFDTYLQKYEESWRLFSDARPCLIGLEAHELGIITNGARSQQQHKLNLMGISSYFSVVVTSEEVGVAKPDTAIFRLACARANVEPCECVYVGDRLDLDVEPAQAAGLRGILLTRHEQNPVSPCTLAIRSLSELREAIAA